MLNIFQKIIGNWKKNLKLLILYSLFFIVASFGLLRIVGGIAQKSVEEDLHIAMEQQLKAASEILDLDAFTELVKSGEFNAEGFSDDDKFNLLLYQLDTIHKQSPDYWPYLYVSLEYYLEARDLVCEEEYDKTAYNYPCDSPENTIVFIVDVWTLYDPDISAGFLESYTPNSGFIANGISESTYRAVNHPIVQDMKNYADTIIEKQPNLAARLESFANWLNDSGIFPSQEFGTYGDQYGRWASGYGPLVDRNGVQVGAIGIDVQADEVNEVRSLWQERFRNILIGVYPILLVIIFFISSSNTQKNVIYSEKTNDLKSENNDLIVSESELHNKEPGYLSLRWKLLIGFSIIYTMIFVFGGIYLDRLVMRIAQESVEKSIQSTTSQLVEAASEILDLDAFTELVKSGKINAEGFSNDDEFNLLLNQLDIIHKQSPDYWPYLYVSLEYYLEVRDLVCKEEYDKTTNYYPCDSLENTIVFIVDVWTLYDPDISAGFLESYTTNSGFIANGISESTYRAVNHPVVQDIKNYSDTIFEKQPILAARLENFANWLNDSGIFPSQEFGTYGDQYGRWASGYGPLVDKNGVQVGAIGIDVQADEVIYVRELAQERLRSLFVIAYPALLGIVSIAINYYVRPITKISQAAKKIGQGDYDVDIPNSTSSKRYIDEIDQLSLVLSDMKDMVEEREIKLKRQVAQLKSVFMSYSSKDDEFAQMLYRDLKNKGVRVWFAPVSLRAGEEFSKIIFEEIKMRDKFILILSGNSTKSDWVKKEMDSAIEQEIKRNDNKSIGEAIEPVLFPIRIDNVILDSKEGWIRNIKSNRHILDFSAWKDEMKYNSAFEQLFRDLSGDENEL